MSDALWEQTQQKRKIRAASPKQDQKNIRVLKIRTTGDHRLAFHATVQHQISGSFLVENVCGTDEHQIRNVKDETSYH